MKQCAFLRGVNVGGHNKVPMPELKTALIEAGFTGVSTYIQSGNVMFEEGSAAQIENIIRERFSAYTAAVVRSADELRAIIANNPYEAGKTYVTLLLSAVPEFEQIDGKGDEYTHIGSEIYILMNNPAHESKLQNAVFERRSGAKATTRNLRTLTEILNRMK